MERISLKISGMSCGHCVGRVTSALKSMPGVNVENVAIGSATVSYDPKATTAAEIATTVTDAGYAAEPASHTT